MTILVTGANGFVGRGVLRRLALGGGVQVRALVRRVDDARHMEIVPGGGAKLVASGDLTERPPLTAALEGVSHVVHLAGRAHVMRESAADSLGAFRAMNVDATMHLARAAAAAGVRRFVFVSSVKAQAEQGTLREDDPPRPLDPYGVSKLEAETALRGFAAGAGLELVIIRPPLVYGPGVGANFARLMRTVDRGLPLPFGRVDNRRSLVARANLADLIATVLEHRAAVGETFNVSDGEDLSTPELIRRIARALGRPARLVPVPVILLRAGARLTARGDLAQRLLGSLQLDISKARTLLGWRPPVGVDQALTEMAQAWRTGEGP